GPGTPTRHVAPPAWASADCAKGMVGGGAAHRVAPRATMQRETFRTGRPIGLRLGLLCKGKRTGRGGPSACASGYYAKGNVQDGAAHRLAPRATIGLPSGDDRREHLPMHVRQTEIAASVTIGELFMIDAQQ